MKLEVPHPAEGSPVAGDEIAWRRELKQLRVRVAQLEAERGIRQAPSIEVERSKEHGYQCGHPCSVVVMDPGPTGPCGSKATPTATSSSEEGTHERRRDLDDTDE